MILALEVLANGGLVAERGLELTAREEGRLVGVVWGARAAGGAVGLDRGGRDAVLAELGDEDVGIALKGGEAAVGLVGVDGVEEIWATAERQVDGAPAQALNVPERRSGTGAEEGQGAAKG